MKFQSEDVSGLNWMVRLAATLQMAVFGLAATAATIPLEVAKPIQSHMVLQRGRDVCRVWGRATPGSEVTVTFANGGRTIVAKGTAAATGDTVGLWEANLGRLVASDNPETLTVTCGGESLTVEDVLVGDVWLNLGQSNASMNMGWPTVNWGGEKEPAPNGDKIRSTAIYCGSSSTRSDYAFPTAAYAYACDWGRSTDAATYKFIPAMGYHFARRLVRETGVPVGVLGVSSGGLSCSAYAPGGAVWNASYYPLRRYAVSGVLWYQGENGTTAKDQKNLVDGLREAWGYSPDEMPFYCVEVNFCGTAVVYPNADGVVEMSAKSKTDALYAVPTSAILQGGWRDYCDRVELVSCRDFADPRSEWDAYFMPAGMGLSCHNRVKKLVGERLALYALRDVYQPAGEYWTGHTVTAGGPRFETATAEANGRVRVTFKAGTTGLGLTAGGKTLRLGESPAFTGGDMGTSLPKDLLEVPYDNEEPVTTDEPIRGWALGEANGATTNWAWAVATVDKGGELVLWARGIRRPNVVFYGFVPNPARFFNCYAKTTQRRDGKDVTVLLPAELTVPQAVTGVSAATERTSFQAVSLAACTVEPISTQYVHANGALPRPHPVVTAPDGTLVSECAFSCVYTYADGKGTVTLTGDGKDVIGTRTVVFDVKAFDFADALIRNIANVNYTGDPVEPKFTFFGFVYPQTVLGITHEDCIVPTAGVDYDYELSNNVNPGVATLVLRGNGTATRGALTRTFKIVGNLKTATAITVDPIADQSFTGVAITPSVTLRLKDGTALKEGTDYTLAYANNTAIGKATVTVTGKGNYAGARTANFNIVSGEVTNFLVTFKDWDGATLKSDYVAKGASAAAPPDPSRVGYRFTGWLPADFSSVTDNLTVVAQYVEDGTVVQTWRVVWQNWDGTVLKEEDVEDGHDATAPGDPTKPNATFNGWSSSGKNITSDMVIVAQFIGGAAKTYTITFVDGWGTTLSTQEVEEGKSAVKPENPTHEGYVFTGWDTVEWEYAAADTVVTAQWRKDEGGEDPTGHEDDNPGEIVLSPLYQDHMVLQRDQAITVWGKNAAGRKVTVSFGGKTATAMTGADGSWTATFDSAFVVETTGRTMTVTDDAGHKVTVLDVVVGDVYLATGQSNMDLRLVAVGDYVFTNGTERGDALLRYRRMPRGVSRANPLAFDTLEPTDENRARNWTLTTDETARNAMSACAYYFGMKLREEVPGVPVGVVVASMGATIITWHMTPETVAAEKAAGRVYNADASKCWNAMLNPIRKGSFRGAIWYQGESDGSVGTEDYFLRMQALVQGWRDVWGSDFAFYCVQLHVVTTYKHDDGTVAAPDLAGNACQREAQRRWFMDDTGRKGLAVICATSTVDTHAKDKQFVGERLARFALKDFNGSTANACGPLFKSATDAGSGRVRVTFEAGTAKGLSAGSRTGESAKKPNQPVVLDPAAAIKGFALSENGKDWVFADTVTVDGETLLVSATGLGAPAYIHYGSWNNPYARGINLFNADKLECSPFAPVQVSGGDTPTHAHAWGDWTTNAVPTCVTDGSMSRTCAAEGCAIGTETKKLDRLGHAWGEWIVTKPAEVGVKGEETRLCSRCELAETREIAPLPRPEDRHPMANAESGYYMEVEINGVTNRVEVFTNATQAISWTVPADVTKLDYLVVGGGGGGGYQYGGGGGGGGVLEGTASVVPGATLSVTVGAGGAGGASASTPGANGSASALANGEVEFARAPGGGGGAYLRTAGLAGANGGGGSKGAGGKPTMDGGFAGGGSTGVDGGSGGGGAGGVGGLNNGKTDQTGVCGAGGLGVESAITGAAVRYAGGGGGGGAENGSGATYYAAGGLGTDGGGNGGTRLVEDGVYVTGVAATPGTDGLGGGGGGGAHGSNKARMVGAKGGDGVVIIRYVTAGGEPVEPPDPEPVVAGENLLRQEFSVTYSSPEAAASATLPTVDVLPDGYTYAFTLRLDDSSFRSFYAMLGGQIGSTVYDGAIGRALAEAGIGASCYHYHNSGGTVNGTECSDKADPTLDVMSGFQKQVLALSDTFEIGSHTYDHMLLGKAGPNANFFEVMASRALLEAMSQSPVHAEAAAGYSNHATYTPAALVRAGYIFQADGLSVPERGLFGASRMSVEGNNAQPETFWNNCSNVTKRLSPGGCLEGGSHPYLISNPCADLLEDVRMLREDGRFWIVRPTVYASYRLQATLSRIEKVSTDGAQATYVLMRPVPSRVGALTPLSVDVGPNAVAVDGISVGDNHHVKLAYPEAASLPLRYDAVRNADNTDGEVMACPRLPGIATRLRIDETANLAVLKLKNTTESVLSVKGRLRLPPRWTTEAFALDFAVAPGGEKTVSIPLGTVVAETPAEGEVLYADAEMEFVVEGKLSRLHATTFAPSFAGTPEPPAHEHFWSDWVETKQAEVGVPGEETRTCAGCGETETRETDPLPGPGPEPEPGEREATDYGYRMKVAVGSVTNMVCVFTNVTKTWEWTVPSGVTALYYLVVGGGGGGGAQYGGGGGGGGVITNASPLAVNSGDTLTVLVGAGGAGGAYENRVANPGANGGTSAITNGTTEIACALGGGGGAKLRSAGLAGANGGGGSKALGGAPTMAGGFAGGGNTSSDVGSGGGGAGGAGGKSGPTSATGVGGAGGLGVECAITGSAVRYAGGGGGGGADNGTVGTTTYYAAGGVGCDGGGNGGSREVADGVYVGPILATPGVDGLGGGGGGGAHGTSPKAGAKGGDGVVILRYALAGGEPPVEPQPTVDGKRVDPKEVFDVATSAKPIVYPRAPKLAGVPGEQTIEFDGAKVAVPVYYTATLAETTVSLVLNENAKPRIADEDATQAFVLTADGKVELHLTNVHPRLFYALETCGKLGDGWPTGEFVQGQAKFTAERDPDTPAAFYRVVVHD